MTASRYDVDIVEAVPEARFELIGHHAQRNAALQAAGLPVPSAARFIARAGGVRVAWVGPRRVIICAPVLDAGRIRTLASAAIPAASSTILADITGSTVTFVLSGRDVVDVLAQGIAYDVSTAHFSAGSILTTEGWGVGLVLELDGEQVRVTVDTALAAYVQNCLCTAAGLPAETAPGIMRSPPPALLVRR